MNYGKSKALFGRFVLSQLKWMLLMPSDDFCNFLFPYHCIFNKHSKHKQREHEKCFSLSPVPVVRPIEVLKQLLNQNRIRKRNGENLRASASLSIFSGGFPTVFLPFFGAMLDARIVKAEIGNLKTVYLFFQNVFSRNKISITARRKRRQRE